MKNLLKALAAGALTLMVTGTASAHGPGHGRVMVEVRPYYPPLVQVQPRYVPAPAYSQQRYVYVEPAYRAGWRHAQWRHEQWRDDQWRDEQWRHEQWRREQWRREHWRHARCHDHHWRR